MKSIPSVLCLLFLTLATPSCYDTDPVPAPPTQPSEPVPKAQAELEKKIEVEQSLRQQTQSLLEKQLSSTSAWQTFSLFAVAAAVLLLVVGTSLGAKARHDAGTSQP